MLALSSTRRGARVSRTAARSDRTHDVRARFVGQPSHRSAPLGLAFSDEDLDRPPAGAALRSPDRLGPHRRRDTHDVVGAPRPQPDAVEDEAVTRPSRREPVDAHDRPVVHLGHPDGYDEVERLAGSFGRKASFVGDPIDERRSAR